MGRHRSGRALAGARRDPVLERKAHDGRWTTNTESPVPFWSLAAWPSELVEDKWEMGQMLEKMRMEKRWKERVLEDEFGTW